MNYRWLLTELEIKYNRITLFSQYAYGMIFDRVKLVKEKKLRKKEIRIVENKSKIKHYSFDSLDEPEITDEYVDWLIDKDLEERKKEVLVMVSRKLEEYR